MPFKIVKTIENGKFVLTTVPSKWESRGVLYWPKRDQDTLRRDGNTEPKDDWMSFNCIVIKTNLKTFQKSERDIARMCPNSDSDSDGVIGELRSQAFVDMAQVAQERMSDDDTPLVLKMEPLEVMDDEPEHNSELQENSTNQNNVTSETDPSKLPSLLKELSTKMNIIIESNMTLHNSIKAIQKNQKVLYNNQQRLILKISKISAQFEQAVQQNTIVSDKQKFDIQLITSLEALQAFERSLESPETTAELKKKFSVICGKGRGRGINNAYTLVDAIFDRHFMEKCSWAGGSRSSESKICFKSCTKVINFFFDIVYESDNTFTLTDCHTFFKNILKNSHSRSKSKKLRASTAKNRRKKLMLLNSKDGAHIFKPIDITEGQVDQTSADDGSQPPFSIAEMFSEVTSMQPAEPERGSIPPVKHTHPLETSV